MGIQVQLGPSAKASDFELTDSAASKIQEMLKDEANAGKCLRVYVIGGGCSGFQYGFKFDDRAPGDAAVEKNGVTMVVDPMSGQYLKGAQVDYVNNLMGAQFVVNNPNASTTCGCGASFSV